VRLPWPATLVGRTILVMVAGLIISQIASIVVFSANRFQLESRLLGSHVADRIAAAVRIAESTPAADRAQLQQRHGSPASTISAGWTLRHGRGLAADNASFASGGKSCRAGAETAAPTL